jgi:hypothetical protein
LHRALICLGSENETIADVFAVQGVEKERWLAVAPVERPPGRMFDRRGAVRR